MSKKEILVPFDLAKAKAGAKLKTANGDDARIVCYDFRGKGTYPIVAIVNDKTMGREELWTYNETGQWMSSKTSSNDLRIVEEIEEQDRWIETDKGGVEGWSLADTGQIVHSFACKDSVCWATIFAKKKMARAAKAAAMISQIIANDKRFGGAITDEEWDTGGIDKFVFYRIQDRITLSTARDIYNFIAFHTQAQAALFLEENRDLIRQFYML